VVEKYTNNFTKPTMAIAATTYNTMMAVVGIHFLQ
jgi:hypothetical protein